MCARSPVFQGSKYDDQVDSTSQALELLKQKCDQGLYGPDSNVGQDRVTRVGGSSINGLLPEFA